MAHPIRSHHRRLNAVCRRLHPHFLWPLLWIVQGPARAALVARRDHPSLDDGYGVLWLHLALGANELLGRYGDHESFLRSSFGRRQHCDMALGRICGWRSDTPPLLCASLLIPVRDRRGRWTASHRAPPAPIGRLCFSACLVRKPASVEVLRA